MPDANLSFDYDRWLENATECSHGELVALVKDEDALRDAFYRDLAFGTGAYVEYWASGRTV